MAEVKVDAEGKGRHLHSDGMQACGSQSCSQWVAFMLHTLLIVLFLILAVIAPVWIPVSPARVLAPRPSATRFDDDDLAYPCAFKRKSPWTRRQPRGHEGQLSPWLGLGWTAHPFQRSALVVGPRTPTFPRHSMVIATNKRA